MDDTFKTIYKGDYIWPYIVPLQFIPKKPPDTSTHIIGKQDDEESILDKKLCACERHSWNPHFQRARYLKEKELAYREAMLSLAHQRTILENEILNHPCTESENFISSLYNIDYAKKEFPITDYRTMKSDHDDPVINPVAMPKDPKTSKYKDTSSFRKVAIPKYTIHSDQPISFVEDVGEKEFRKPTKSEYDERFSTLAKINERSLQMFQETPYSSRR